MYFADIETLICWIVTQLLWIHIKLLWINVEMKRNRFRIVTKCS